MVTCLQGVRDGQEQEQGQAEPAASVGSGMHDAQEDTQASDDGQPAEARPERVGLAAVHVDWWPGPPDGGVGMVGMRDTATGGGADGR